MTAHPSPRTPVYTSRDLAELVAKHDREHPGHAEDCGCQNGLIWTLRIYFAPSILGYGSEGPRPYVPPDLLSSLSGAEVRPAESPEVIERKPWLKQRDRETKAEHDYRISHSCYNCGIFIVDSAALNQHEDQCSLHGRHHDA